MSNNAGENNTEHSEAGVESFQERRARVVRESTDGASVSLSRRGRAKNWIASFPRAGFALALGAFLAPLLFVSLEISNVCGAFALCLWAALALICVALGEDDKLGAPSQSATIVGFVMAGALLFGGVWFNALMKNVVDPSTAKVFASQVRSSEALGNLAWSRLEKLGVSSPDGERAAAAAAVGRFEASKADAYKTARAVAAKPWMSWDASLSEDPRSSFQRGYFVDTMSERLSVLQTLSANIAAEQLVSQEKSLIGQQEEREIQRQAQERLAKGRDVDAKWLPDQQRAQFLGAIGLDLGTGSGGWDFSQSQGAQMMTTPAPLSGLEGPGPAFNRDEAIPQDNAPDVRPQLQKTEADCQSRKAKSISSCVKSMQDEKNAAHMSFLAPFSYSKGWFDQDRPAEGATREQALARDASLGEARLQWAPPAHAPQIDYDQVAADAARRAMSAERIGAMDMGGASMVSGLDPYQNREQALSPLNFVSGSQDPRAGGYVATQAPQMKLPSESAQASSQGRGYPNRATRLAIPY